LGYSICVPHNRRTCDACDACPACYGLTFRHFRCPFGWCPRFRACIPCTEKHGFSTAKAKHQQCQRSSERFHAELAAQRKATDAGLPVIKAGVSCGDGRVFAWTTLGNYRLPSEDYQAGLDRQDNVVSLDRAERTTAEHPKEVYGEE